MPDPCKRVPIVTGSGRSGTTWILDVLAEANSLRPVFEPLYPGCGSIAQKFQCTYLSPQDEAPELASYFRRILAREQTNSFIDYRISPHNLRFGLHRFGSLGVGKQYVQTLRKLVRRRRQFRSALRQEAGIVKLIRANWLLAWLTERLAANVVHVIRHPGAVADSQQRAIAYWVPEPRIKRYLESDVIKQAYEPQLASIELDKLSEFAKLVLLWCIENAEPVRRQGAFGYTAVFYEELQHGYPGSWKPVLTALDLKTMPKHDSIVRPSQQSSARWTSNQIGGERRNSTTWRDRRSRADRAEFEMILGLFEIDFYTWERNEPDVSEYCAWLPAESMSSLTGGLSNVE